MYTLFTVRDCHTSGNFYVDSKNNTFSNTGCGSEESFIKYSKTTERCLAKI